MDPMKTITLNGQEFEITDAQARATLQQIVEGLPTVDEQMRNAFTQVQNDIAALQGEMPTSATIVDLIYPVGSIYLSVNSTNPAQLFGGSWQQISQGRMLMGAATQGSIQQNTGNTGLFGTLDSNELNYKFGVGQLGGKYRHTLTAAESGLPSHVHPAGTDRAYASAPAGTTIGEKGAASGTAFYAPSIASDSNWYTQQNTGSNNTAAAQNPHNNMPPYMTVNIWERTA
jgi:microcystin-dependent protein